MPDKRKGFEVLEGGAVDPSDVDTSDEELEAIALRLADSRLVIDSVYEPHKRLDQTIIKIRNGLELMEELAETGGSIDLALIVDESIRTFLIVTETADRAQMYRSLSGDMVEALRLLNIFMHENLAQLRADYPSEAWNIPEVKDAITQGLVYSDEVLRALLPPAQNESSDERRQRFVEYLEKECDEITKQAEEVEFEE